MSVAMLVVPTTPQPTRAAKTFIRIEFHFMKGASQIDVENLFGRLLEFRDGIRIIRSGRRNKRQEFTGMQRNLSFDFFLVQPLGSNQLFDTQLHVVKLTHKTGSSRCGQSLHAGLHKSSLSQVSDGGSALCTLLRAAKSSQLLLRSLELILSAAISFGS